MDALRCRLFPGQTPTTFIAVINTHSGSAFPFFINKSDLVEMGQREKSLEEYFYSNDPCILEGWLKVNLIGFKDDFAHVYVRQLTHVNGGSFTFPKRDVYQDVQDIENPVLEIPEEVSPSNIGTIELLDQYPLQLEKPRIKS